MQAVESGLFSIKRPPIESPLGKALFAAKVNALHQQRSRELASLQHTRALVYASTVRSKSAIDEENRAYYAIFNAISGMNLDPDKAKQRQLQAAKQKYANAVLKLTGLHVDSPEFQAQLDAQCEAIMNPKPVD